MRNLGRAAALVALTALFTSCGGDTSSNEATGDSTTPSSTASAAATPSPEWTGQVIPDGTYTKSWTVADARKLGLPKDDATEAVGEDGKQTVEIRIARDRWVQAQEIDGSMVVGDEGTSTYDADGNWVPISHSSGCPGCTATFEWSLEGDRLMLTLLESSGSTDPMDAIIGRLLFEGELART